MSEKNTKFNMIKEGLSNKWLYVRCNDNVELEKLNFDGLRAFSISLLNSGLNPYLYIKKLFKDFMIELVSFNITKKTEKKWYE